MCKFGCKDTAFLRDMQIYLRKSCGKMDFDEVLMRVSAKMVDI